ncbi:PilZ domain protein [compost metagenome]
MNKRNSFRLKFNPHLIAESTFGEICIVDLSAHGIGFKSNHKTPLGSEIDVHFQLQGESFRLTGKVVREGGIETFLFDTAQAELIAFLNKFTILQKKRPWHVRYRQCTCAT